MVNTEKFSKRLEKIMAYYDLSAAAFADKVDVGRSSISHILSGRNKPSLDFVLKVISNFPEVELYWLLNGKGTFPLEAEKEQLPSPTSTQEKESLTIASTPKNTLTEQPHIKSSLSKEIHKVIILYKDGSFESFEN